MNTYNLIKLYETSSKLAKMYEEEYNFLTLREKETPESLINKIVFYTKISWDAMDELKMRVDFFEEESHK